ncbi:MAG: 2,4-dihydroxyhept-2-ene-1,7-dioic acid aldolase [Defluviimonas sp.]|uniref:HpcH/HpaI aldolase family protein n=1 Tax=Albidovulum sp. TaxID=1872424 RepID=UPI001DE340FE|nr:2,4-dihydroxyhept-2-ene-1,7-dioic acid aldolase [Paracoccaceae bacterium]MCC0063166.1 2,4-dihydroxyhept-2-ene-1,7-dioic acid aldolase [Defluviimonas sp.]
MRRNLLRQRFAEGRPIVNAWLAIPSAYSAEVIGHQGFDSVTVDLQHGMIGFDAAVPMLQALSSTPAVPLARVSKCDYALVMQLLDAGAYGIICPMISTPAQAREFASFCRYPPGGGQRSFGPARGLLYGGADYFAHADAEILALPMIETREAVANVDAILATPGIDGIYIGPNDLCLSHDCAPAPEPADAAMAGLIRDLAAAAGRAGKMAGIFCSGGEAAKGRVGDGFHMVTPGNDVALLSRASKAAVAAVRGEGAAAPTSKTGY